MGVINNSGKPAHSDRPSSSPGVVPGHAEDGSLDKKGAVGMALIRFCIDSASSIALAHKKLRYQSQF